MNAAELYTFITIVGCPIAAGTVGASQKGGWSTLLFVVARLAIGFGFSFVINKLAYRLLDVSGRQAKAVALTLAYLLVPPTVAFGAIAGCGWLASLFVRHVL